MAAVDLDGTKRILNQLQLQHQRAVLAQSTAQTDLGQAKSRLELLQTSMARSEQRVQAKDGEISTLMGLNRSLMADKDALLELREQFARLNCNNEAAQQHLRQEVKAWASRFQALEADHARQLTDACRDAKAASQAALERLEQQLRPLQSANETLRLKLQAERDHEAGVLQLRMRHEDRVAALTERLSHQQDGGSASHAAFKQRLKSIKTSYEARIARLEDQLRRQGGADGRRRAGKQPRRSKTGGS